MNLRAICVTALFLLQAAVLSSGTAFAQDEVLVSPAGDGSGLLRVESAVAPAPTSKRVQPQRRLSQLHTPALVVLGAVEASSLERKMLDQPSRLGAPLKIGFGRDVPVLKSRAATAQHFLWSAIPDGQIAALSITSPDALGVRLGLLIERLPARAVLRFYAQNAGQVYEVSGQEINTTLDRNSAAGDTSEEARTYWSPLIEGPEVTLEIEIPAGVAPTAVAFSIPRVSHFFSSPQNTRALREKIGQSDACNLDSICYTSTWSAEALATAKMTYIEYGSPYLCTGTLVKDSDASSYIPYFLSANHCISTQTVASTLQTHWFYHSSNCNSSSLYYDTQTVTGGATLLYHSTATDTSFMRLHNSPPSGAVFSGWSANLPARNTPVAGIHHPSGDMQKISFGSITDYMSCTTDNSAGFSCSPSSSSGSNFLEVVWNAGITESGSSGSGLWVNVGGGHYLVGQLRGGSSSCSSPAAHDTYGRFDVAYNAALKQWLNSGSNTPTQLTNGIPVTNISGYEDSEANYVITLPPGATNLVITLSTGSGDADLYVRAGSMPTTSAYDCRSYNDADTAEQCAIGSPQAGAYYVTIRGFTNYAQLTLTARYTAPANDSDRVFNYLQSAYPQFLAPANAASATLAEYYYRYYAGTNAYIATANGQVYYLGPLSGGGILALGTLADWLARAAGAGY